MSSSTDATQFLVTKEHRRIVEFCATIRISRATLFQGDASRGSLASRKRDSYGLKLPGLVTRGGQPVEFSLTPAAVADVTA